MPESETFYELLGVEESADQGTIEAAYRERVKETHPDVSDAPDAEERFKRVKRAKEVLTDTTERERYDRLGHEQYLQYGDHFVNHTDHPDAGTSTGGPDGRRSPGHRDSGADSTRDPGAADRGFTPGDDAGEDGDADAASPGSGTTGGSDDPGRNSDPGGGSHTGTGTGTGTDTDGRADNGTGGTADGRGFRDADPQQGTSSHTDRGPHWSRHGSGPGSRRGQTPGEGGGYAVRNEFEQGTFDSVRVPLTPGSLIQVAAMFLFYPVFVFASVFPGFPLVVNLVVAACTLVVIAYLMSIPEVGIVVFGGWSLLVPAVLLASPSLQLFSFYGVVALCACWLPLGLSFTTRSVMRI